MNAAVTPLLTLLLRRETRSIANRHLLLMLAVAAILGGLTFWLPSLQQNRASATSLQIPAHLDILTASIEEIPPIDAANVAARPILFRIDVADAPPCISTTGILAYGVLIDADRNPTTGVTDPAFADLGVDARAAVECDPALGVFVSALGAVSVTTDVATGVTRIELLTSGRQLPSTDFQWIAFAQEGPTFIRLPAEPNAGRWAIHERALF
jgi:hypothetical protein